MTTGEKVMGRAWGRHGQIANGSWKWERAWHCRHFPLAILRQGSIENE
jgi:hypothetical protein